VLFPNEFGMPTTRGCSTKFKYPNYDITLDKWYNIDYEKEEEEKLFTPSKITQYIEEFLVAMKAKNSKYSKPSVSPSKKKPRYDILLFS